MRTYRRGNCAGLQRGQQTVVLKLQHQIYTDATFVHIYDLRTAAYAEVGGYILGQIERHVPHDLAVFQRGHGVVAGFDIVKAEAAVTAGDTGFQGGAQLQRDTGNGRTVAHHLALHDVAITINGRCCAGFDLQGQILIHGGQRVIAALHGGSDIRPVDQHTGKHPAGIRADKQLRLTEALDRKGRAGLAVAEHGGTVRLSYGYGVRAGHCGGDFHRVVVVICKDGQAKAAK